jgi:hypothetical protein
MSVEGSGYWVPNYGMSKEKFLKLNIKEYSPNKKLSYKEILKLPKGTLVYAKAVKDIKTQGQWFSNQLMMKGETQFFYYRDTNPHTCYFDYDGYFGGLHDIKAYEYYTISQIDQKIIPKENTCQTIESNNGLTSEENEISKLIVDVWDKFTELKQTHLSDIEDVQKAIHQLQNVLGMRTLRRLYPKHYMSYKEKNNDRDQ